MAAYNPDKLQRLTSENTFRVRKLMHTLINIVSREEALLSVGQLTHPPVVVILEQDCDTVTTFQ